MTPGRFEYVTSAYPDGPRAMLADVSREILEGMQSFVMPPLDGHCRDNPREVTLSPSAEGLYLMTSKLSREIQDRALGGGAESFTALMELFGVDPSELRPDNINFAHLLLLSDKFRLAFTLAPGIASNVNEQFVADGLMTNEQHALLTFSDWADEITTPWFKTIMHNLAFTSSTGDGSFLPYEDFGKSRSDYARGALRERLSYGSLGVAPDERTFNTDIKDDQLSAQLSPTLTKKLREIMRQNGTHGCPMAIGQLVVERGQEDNLHVGKLRRAGYLTNPAVTEKGTTRFDMRLITEATIVTLAGQLRAYDERNGTPRLGVPTQYIDPRFEAFSAPDKVRHIIHEKRPKSGLFAPAGAMV